LNAENDSTKHMTAYSTIIQGCRKDAPGAQAEFYDLHAQPLPKELEATYQLENKFGVIDIDKGIKTLNHTATEKRFFQSCTGSIGKANASARIKLTGTHSTISLTQK
jgi:hypothetical protein